MTRLYFVRHAESSMNLRSEIIGGRSHYAHLSDLGNRQADAFGEWLKQSDIEPDVIVASPAIRTMQTMRRSVKAAGLTTKFFVDHSIIELSQGLKVGTPRELAYTPDVVSRIKNELLDFKFEGGESLAMVMKRMGNFAVGAAKRYPDQTVLVYSHGMAIRCLAGAIDNLEHQQIVFDLKTPNVSLTAIDISPDEQTVHYVGKRVINEDSV